MVGIVHNPWRRIGLRAVILAVLGALFLAGSAQAAEAGETATVSGVPVPSAETVLSGTTPVPAPETVLSGTTPVPAPETVLSAPGPETGAPLQATPPTSAPVLPSPSPEVASHTPAPAPEVASAPEPVQSTPAPEPVPTPGTGLASGPEKTPETVLDGSAAGKDQETLLSATVPGAQGNALVISPAGGGSPPPPGAPPPAAVGLPEVPSASSAGPPSVGVSTPMTAAQRDRQFDCDFSSLGEHATRSCSSGGLGAQRLLSQSPMASVASVASVAASAGSPPNGGHGGSGVGSPPVNPAPGPTPAPSGASGSAAGSSGIALSGFLTLAGLLLLGAPRAMRRLRLSCQPWRTACFVLIPERPG